MKIIVDANNPKDILNFHFGKNLTRGYSKTYSRLMWDLAFIESQSTGKPVEYEVGFTEYRIDEV